MATEHGWAIANETTGLYIGWHMTRNDAIGEHVSQTTGIGVHSLGRRLNNVQSGLWKTLKKNGDRAVKIKITYK